MTETKDRRVRLMREGHETNDGRFIESGATTWTSKIIPLLVMLRSQGQGHDGARLCGYVSDMARETDGSGWVTGRLHTTLYLRGLACEVDLDQLAFDRHDDGPMVVSAARLAAVTLGINPTWDDMIIGVDHA